MWLCRFITIIFAIIVVGWFRTSAALFRSSAQPAGEPRGGMVEVVAGVTVDPRGYRREDSESDPLVTARRISAMYCCNGSGATIVTVEHFRTKLPGGCRARDSGCHHIDRDHLDRHHLGHFTLKIANIISPHRRDRTTDERRPGNWAESAHTQGPLVGVPHRVPHLCALMSKLPLNEHLAPSLVSSGHGRRSSAISALAIEKLQQRRWRTGHASPTRGTGTKFATAREEPPQGRSLEHSVNPAWALT